MADTTSNFNFNLTDFNKIPWHTLDHDNWHIADALMARFLAVSNVQGVWLNALDVSVDERYIDTGDDTIWEVLVAHTTPSSGTFAASRTAVPANWQTVSVDATFAGAWTEGTVYSVNQFITDSARYGVTVTAHTAVTSYDTGVANGDIVTLVDVSGVNLPATVTALAFLRGNAAATGQEYRTVAQMLVDLSLVIGTDVQAWAAALDAVSGTNTGDMTDAEVKTAYENNADTNAVTDAEKVVLGNTSNTNTGDEPTATDSAEGVVELATTAEGNTGTATDKIPPVDVVKAMIDTHAASGATLGTEVDATNGGSDNLTLIDFTSIPAGTTKITVMIEQLSTSGTSLMQVQIGDAGGIENTGYDSDAGAVANNFANSTTGFLMMQTTIAASLYNGVWELVLFDAATFQWAMTGMVTTNNDAHFTAGHKSLSAELTQIRITTVGGSDTFDNGAINIQYS